MHPHESSNDDVAIIGLSYVGLPLAVTLAARGHTVVGVEIDPAIRSALQDGRAPFHEAGLDEALADLPPGSLTVVEKLPDVAPAVIVICVGTPYSVERGGPVLDHLEAAAEEAARVAGPDTLTVVRSTVPVGTCRRVVLPRLAARVPEPMLAFCPERLIQGRALAEITTLPQLVGGVDKRSAARAGGLHAQVTERIVTLSSLEAAEAVKLICNAHTDLLYGFGNEVAVLADTLGLDAIELIEGANDGYPRPDLARPGFVGGSCLTKDPYLLSWAASAEGYEPPMVLASRRVNEQVPGRIAARFLRAWQEASGGSSTARVIVAGVAYKGRPGTDDVRGGSAVEVAEVLRAHDVQVLAHDPVVPWSTTERLGLEPVALQAGPAQANALIVLSEHPEYGALTASALRELLVPPRVIVDMWGVLESELAEVEDVRYVRWGRG